MSIQTIKESEIRAAAVASLATRPSTPSLYGGRTLSAEELRAAFDRLPRLIAERLNALIVALGMEADEVESIADAIPSGLAEGHTLADLLRDISSGGFAAYLSADGIHTVAEQLELLLARTVLPAGHDDLLSYIERPVGQVTAGTALPVSGGAVREAIDQSVGGHDRADASHAAMQKELHAEDAAIYGAIRDQFRLYREEDGVYRLYSNVAPRGQAPNFQPVAASATLTVPKDLVVTVGSIETCATADQPLVGLAVGDKYLDLTLANAAGDHLYVRVSDLVDQLNLTTAGTGDLLTALTVEGSRMTATFGASRADFVSVDAFEARMEKLEAAADSAFFSRETVTVNALRAAMPADAVGTAELTLIGGRTCPTFEISNLTDLSVLQGTYDGLTITYDADARTVTLDGTLYGSLYFFIPAVVANGRALHAVFERLSGSVTTYDSALAIYLCPDAYPPIFTVSLTDKEAITCYAPDAATSNYTIDQLILTSPNGTTFEGYTFRLALGDDLKRSLVATVPQAFVGKYRVELPEKLANYTGMGEGIDETLYNYMAKEDGNWVLHRPVQRKAFTGTETVTQSSTDPDENGLYCFSVMLAVANVNNRSLRSICSHYKERTAEDGTVGILCEVTSRKAYARFYLSEVTTVEEFKAMLKAEAERGAPITVIYEMYRTPVGDVVSVMPPTVHILPDETGAVTCETSTGKPVTLSFAVSVPGGRFAEVERRVDELAHTTALRSWRDVQRVVRAGRAADYFSVGDLLFCERNGVPMEWTVIGIDHDIPADPAYTHSLTLQTSRAVSLQPFHRHEALFFLPFGLEAGSYYFTIPAGIDDEAGGGRSYFFVLAEDTPKEALIFFDWHAGVQAVETPLVFYASPAATKPYLTLSVTEGIKGKSVVGASDPNDFARIYRNGHDYPFSETDVWLQATEAETYMPDHVFFLDADAPDDGFLCGMDADFTAVLGPVNKQVTLPDGEGGYSTQTIARRVFLLSESEVFFPAREGYDEGAPYAYYQDGATDTLPTAEAEAVRIKAHGTELGRWWLRTTVPGTLAACVGVDGSADSAKTDSILGMAPACCIV